MISLIILLVTTAFGENYTTKGPNMARDSPQSSTIYSTHKMRQEFEDPASRTITLTEEYCKNLIINIKPDSCLDCRVGFDINENKVAKADLSGSSTTQNYKLGNEGNIHIDLQEKLQAIVPPFPSRPSNKFNSRTPFMEESELNIGSISVLKDGKTGINGVPTYDENHAALEEACRNKFPHL